MYDYRIYDSDEKMKDFIKTSEYKFERSIRETALKMMDRGDFDIITLCGPSCSGKDTTSKRLKEFFLETGKTVSVVTVDNYFKNRDAIAERELILEGEIKPDYESAKTLRLDELEDTIDCIKNKRIAEVPIYDFVKGSSLKRSLMDFRKTDIVIIEGIQVVYPEVSELLHGCKTLSMFINVPERVTVNGEEYTHEEIRLIRRMVRDRRERSANAKLTTILWEGVLENEHSNIFPNVPSDSFRIDTFLPYELSVLKNSYSKLCDELSADWPESARALDILRKLESVEAVSERAVPSSSLLREFIGGKRT